MNESDKRVRKQFLTMLIASILVSCLSMASSLVTIPAEPEIRVPMVWGGLSSLLGVFIFSFVIYRCAYKKQGTKLLTFFLISSIISVVLTPILYIINKKSSITIPYYGTYMLVGGIMNILWLIVCSKMRKVNKRLQTIK